MPAGAPRLCDNTAIKQRRPNGEHHGVYRTPLGRTWYTKRGSHAKNIPLIALHGGPGSTHRGMLAYLDLAHARQVLIYDQLGCGRSGTIHKKRWNIATFVKELDYLLDAWEISRFHLLGASWGASLALEYYLARPRRKIASLTLQSPLVSASDWQRDANRLVKALPEKTRKVIRYCHEINATDSRVYKDAVTQFYSRHVLRNKKELKKTPPKNANGDQIYQYMWGPSEFQATGTLKNYDRSKDLDKISIPTLIVCGEYDESTPRTLRRYRAKIKGAQLEVISNASHVITKEKPVALNRIVSRFLRQNEH